MTMPRKHRRGLGAVGELQPVPQQRHVPEGGIEAELDGPGALARAPEGAGLVPHGGGSVTEIDGAP